MSIANVIIGSNYYFDPIIITNINNQGNKIILAKNLKILKDSKKKEALSR